MAQYLKPKEFYEEIIESKRKDELTPKAEQMFILLGNRTIKKMKYFVEEDREDCLQTGLMMMFLNWRNFDPEKSTNAFAYFTEIFKRGMAYSYNNWYKLKGDPEGKIKTFSLDSSNDGDGIYNI
jgi:hypothetical protein